MNLQPATSSSFEPVEFETKVTRHGYSRRYQYANGQVFEEFISHRQLFGWPMVHVTRGRNPETGRRVVAKGIFALGRMAVGVVAIGQASAGILAFGQLAIGLLFGLGQATTGFVAFGQLAITAIFGVGQFAVGYVAIGQVAVGKYALAQIGVGEFVWDTRGAAPQAVRFFQSLIP